MEKICSFTINNKVYNIFDVDKIEGRESYVGQSQYLTQNIYIEKSSENQMMLTLKHELMHVWLYENGHTNQNNDEVFGYEDLCELVALSNNSINKIVDLYITSKYY